MLPDIWPTACRDNIGKWITLSCRRFTEDTVQTGLKEDKQQASDAQRTEKPMSYEVKPDTHRNSRLRPRGYEEPNKTKKKKIRRRVWREMPLTWQFIWFSFSLNKLSGHWEKTGWQTRMRALSIVNRKQAQRGPKFSFERPERPITRSLSKLGSKVVRYRIREGGRQTNTHIIKGESEWEQAHTLMHPNEPEQISCILRVSCTAKSY